MDWAVGKESTWPPVDRNTGKPTSSLGVSINLGNPRYVLDSMLHHEQSSQYHIKLHNPHSCLPQVTSSICHYPFVSLYISLHYRFANTTLRKGRGDQRAPRRHTPPPYGRLSLSLQEKNRRLTQSKIHIRVINKIVQEWLDSEAPCPPPPPATVVVVHHHRHRVDRELSIPPVRGLLLALVSMLLLSAACHSSMQPPRPSPTPYPHIHRTYRYSYLGPER